MSSKTVNGMLASFDLTACEDLPIGLRKSIHAFFLTGVSAGVLLLAEAVHKSVIDGEFDMRLFVERMEPILVDLKEWTPGV